MGGGGQPLHGDGGEKRSAGGAQSRAGGVGHRPADLVDIEHGRTDRADGGASSQALDHAPRHQGVHTVSVSQHNQGGDLHTDSGQKDRAPADMVGEPSGGEQRGKQRQGVDTEYDGGGEG